MYDEKTNAQLTDSLLYYSLSHHSYMFQCQHVILRELAKLHKRVHAVSVVFKKSFHIHFLEL